MNHGARETVREKVGTTVRAAVSPVNPFGDPAWLRPRSMLSGNVAEGVGNVVDRGLLACYRVERRDP